MEGTTHAVYRFSEPFLGEGAWHGVGSLCGETVVSRNLLVKYICKESLLLSWVFKMAVKGVVKVTSKGQLTLPVEIRDELALSKDSYLYVARLGNLIVMKKVDELSLDEISTILQDLAEKKGITRELLMREVERARGKLLEERHVKA